MWAGGACISATPNPHGVSMVQSAGRVQSTDSQHGVCARLACLPSLMLCATQVNQLGRAEHRTAHCSAQQDRSCVAQGSGTHPAHSSPAHRLCSRPCWARLCLSAGHRTPALP